MSVWEVFININVSKTNINIGEFVTSHVVAKKLRVLTRFIGILLVFYESIFLIKIPSEHLFNIFGMIK